MNILCALFNIGTYVQTLLWFWNVIIHCYIWSSLAFQKFCPQENTFLAWISSQQWKKVAQQELKKHVFSDTPLPVTLIWVTKFDVTFKLPLIIELKWQHFALKFNCQEYLSPCLYVMTLLKKFLYSKTFNCIHLNRF